MVGSSDADQRWLDGFLKRYDAVAGTVHRVGDGVLLLVAQRGIPPKVATAVSRIPPGKGMAGLAWERGVPVQTCNLQTDDSGDVLPGARAVDARAGAAIPLADADQIVAVVGLAFAFEGEIDDETLGRLSADAATLIT